MRSGRTTAHCSRTFVLLTRALVLAVYTILDDAKQLVLKARRRVARKAPAPTVRGRVKVPSGGQVKSPPLA